MHVSFIPYGKRELVERLLRDMEAQKHFLPMVKGKKKKGIYIDAQVRVLPGGIIEYVFPKEDQDRVMATLRFNQSCPYGVGKALAVVRKIFKYKKIPKFEPKERYLWRTDHVSIIPIGVRHDRTIVGRAELDNGWTHEAI